LVDEEISGRHTPSTLTHLIVPAAGTGIRLICGISPDATRHLVTVSESESRIRPSARVRVLWLDHAPRPSDLALIVTGSRQTV
jgi:hypothetical protein